jgi:hypothetical protein
LPIEALQQHFQATQIWDNIQLDNKWTNNSNSMQITMRPFVIWRKESVDMAMIYLDGLAFDGTGWSGGARKRNKDINTTSLSR